MGTLKSRLLVMVYGKYYCNFWVYPHEAKTGMKFSVFFQRISHRIGNDMKKM